jgi:signal transduction histidine kinase
MRDRVGAAGGSFKIAAEDGHTVVEVKLPTPTPTPV